MEEELNIRAVSGIKAYTRVVEQERPQLCDKITVRVHAGANTTWFSATVWNSSITYNALVSTCHTLTKPESEGTTVAYSTNYTSKEFLSPNNLFIQFSVIMMTSLWDEIGLDIFGRTTHFQRFS